MQLWPPDPVEQKARYTGLAHFAISSKTRGPAVNSYCVVIGSPIPTKARQDLCCNKPTQQRGGERNHGPSGDHLISLCLALDFGAGSYGLGRRPLDKT